MNKKKVTIIVLSVICLIVTIILIFGRNTEYIMYPYSEISIKNNLYYRNGDLFTGKTFLHNNDNDSISLKILKGKLELKIPYNKGVKDGIEEFYQDDGDLWKTPYKNGVKEGIKEVYNTKRILIEKTPYKNGVIEGIKENIYLTSEREYKKLTPYNNGVREGIEEIYDKWGTLRKTTSYSNDKLEGIKSEYNDFGKLSETTPYINDKREGKGFSYDNIGRVSSKTIFENDVSVKTDYGNFDDDDDNSINNSNGVYRLENRYRRMKITIISEKWFGWFKDGDGNGNFDSMVIIKGIMIGKDLYDEYGIQKTGTVSGSSLEFYNPLGNLNLNKLN